MTASPSCPDHVILEHLALGQVSPEEVERWAEHCEQCPHCIQTLHALKTSDTLIEALSARAARGNNPDAEAVGALIERLTAGEQPAAELQATQELYSFLTPPQGPGEIGRLGPYRVLEVLGTGGMGVVLLAEDPKLGRTIALKTLKPAVAADPLARQRFLREAKAAAALEHDHIVSIYHVGEEGGVLFLAMPYLKGEALDDRLRREPRLPLAEVLRIGREVALGLAAAHERGLIHRDIKPANIWLEASSGHSQASPGRKPGEGRVKILDFGLARAVNDSEHLTHQGAIAGTPAYMAPEQAHADPVDARTDLFSLGCVLYRLGTGELPFKGRDTVSTLLALAKDDPRPPRELNPDLPPALGDLILGLLSKDPNGRPASAQVVVAEIQAIEADHTVVTPDLALPRKEVRRSKAPPAPAATPPTRRRSLPVGLAAAVLLLLLGPLAYFYGATLIRIATNKGELVVEVDDPDIEVTVIQNGATVVDRKKGRQFVLTAKGGEVEFFDAETGVRLLTKEFTLERGGKGVVWAKEELAAVRKPLPAASPLDALDPAMIPAAERFTWQPKELVAVIGEHRQRHWGHPYALALSPDGRVLAGGANYDRMVRLWDPATMQLLAELEVDSINCMALAFSPDNRWLVSAHGSTLCFWDRTHQPPRLAHRLPAPRTGERQVQLGFTRDGKALAATGQFGTLSLWDLTRDPPAPRSRVDDPDGQGSALAISPDGKTLATAGPKRHLIKLWDLSEPQPKEIASLEGHTNTVRALLFVREGKQLFSCDADGTLRLWEVNGAASRAKGVVPVGSASGAAFYSIAGNARGDRLVVGDGTGFKLLSLDADPPKLLYSTDAGPVYALAFASDGQGLFIADNTGGLHRFQLGAAAATPTSQAPRLTIYGDFAPFSPAGRLTVGDNNAAQTIWDLNGPAPRRRGEPQGALPGFRPWSTLTADGAVLAASVWRAGSTVVHVWDMTASGLRLAATYARPGQIFPYGTWAPGGKALAVGTQEGSVLLLQRQGDDLKETATLKGHQGNVTSLSFSQDGNTLATRGEDRPARVWDLSGPEPKQRATLDTGEGFRCLSLSPDGKSLAFGHPLQVFDVSGPVPRERFSLQGLSGAVSCLAFSRDGKTIAAGNYSGQLVLWDAATGKKRREWQLPGFINKVWFDGVGRHLLTLNGNGTVYVLRLAPSPASPSPPAPPPPPPAPAVVRAPLDALDPAMIPAAERFAWQPKELVAVIGEHRQRHWSHASALALSPDGRVLASGANYDRMVRLWDPATMQLLAELEVDTRDCTGLAFSSDNRWLASAHLSTLCLWDRAHSPPRLAHRLPVPAADGLRQLGFTRDGKALAVAGQFGSLRLWDLTRDPPALRAGVDEPVVPGGALAVSPDGKTLATAGPKRHLIRLWDLSEPQPKEIASLEGHTNTIRALLFVREGKQLISCDVDSKLRLWEVDGAASRAKGVVPVSGGFCLASNGRGDRLVVGDGNGFRLLSLDADPPKVLYSTNAGNVSAVAFASDGQGLFLADSKGGMHRFQLGAVAATPTAQAPRLTTYGDFAPSSPAGRLMVGDNLTETIWDLDGPAPHRRDEPLPSRLPGFNGWSALAADGTALAAATGRGDSTMLHVWDMTAGGPRLAATYARPPQISCGTWAPGGKTLAVGTPEGSVLLLQRQGNDLRETATLKGHQRTVTSLSFSQDGNTLVTLGVDWQARVWDLSGPDPKQRATLDTVWTYSLSPDGRSLALFLGRRHQVFDVSGPVPTEKFSLQGIPSVSCLAFSADGRTIAGGTHSGQLVLWDAATGKKRRELQLPGFINKVWFDGVGRHLLTLNGNGTVYVLRLPVGPSNP